MQEQEQLHYHLCSIFVDNLFSDQLSRCVRQLNMTVTDDFHKYTRGIFKHNV